MSANMTDILVGLEQAKAEILERAAAVDPPHGDLLRRYYRHVAAEDLFDRDPEELMAAVLAHRELAVHRPQGRVLVRVTTAEADDADVRAQHSVVEVVCDDMPFLVDSVTAELSRGGRAIHLVIHPLLVVRRDLTGQLLDVYPTETAAEVGDGAIVESWMRIEVDRVPDEAGRRALAEDLDRVLRDVREAVEDWPKMQQRALQIAEEIEAEPPRDLPAQEVQETTELLRWLADAHFTFLGYREYVLLADDGDGDDRLVAVHGSGLGILRADQAQSGDAGRLPHGVSTLARQPQLCVVTKANSRSTVHRPAYLDYVGVKTFDDAGQVMGERRFLGLFTSAAYNESIQRIPVLRRKAAEVLARSGFSSNSHSGKDLLQILETYPRDELFQIGSDDLAATALSVMHLQERRQLRLFLRRDAYGRFMSCMVYLPRDRYTTHVRHAMEEILLEAFGGVSIDYTALVSESVLARLHFVVRVDASDAMPDVDPSEVEARLVRRPGPGTTTSSTRCGTSCGVEEGARLAEVYADAFPEAYKEDLPAGDAVADLQRLEALDDRGRHRPAALRAGRRGTR